MALTLINSVDSDQFSTVKRLLTRYCSPTLAGVKPAGLVTFPDDNPAGLHTVVGQYNRMLNQCDVYLRVLHKANRHPLLLVYRLDLLQTVLEDSAISDFLHSCGYPNRDSVNEKLDILARKISVWEDFPHEIGIFLGYPLPDVVSFCQNRGRHYKCCGAWKVYHDVETASKVFSCYRQCREAVCLELAKGASLVRLCQQKFKYQGIYERGICNE